jgi:hypothetical protein
MASLPVALSRWSRMIRTAYESFAPLFFRLRPPLAPPPPRFAVFPDREARSPCVAVRTLSVCFRSVFPDSNESAVADISQWVCQQATNPCGAVLRALANMSGERFQAADVSGSIHFSRRIRYARRVKKTPFAAPRIGKNHSVPSANPRRLWLDDPHGRRCKVPLRRRDGYAQCVASLRRAARRASRTLCG